MLPRHRVRWQCPGCSGLCRSRSSARAERTSANSPISLAVPSLAAALWRSLSDIDMRTTLLSMRGTKLPTRTSARLAKGVKTEPDATVEPVVVPVSRPAAGDTPAPVAKKPRRSPKKAPVDEDLPPLLSSEEARLCTTIAQPKLSFDLNAASEHLCAIDRRFRPLFEKIELKMYRELLDGQVKEVNLFRYAAA